MAEKLTVDQNVENENDLSNENFPLSVDVSKTSSTTTTTTTADTSTILSHLDALRSELSYGTEDEDNNPISSLEPTIDYQPDLNLLTSLTDDSLEDTALNMNNMYSGGGFFDNDTYYTRNAGCHTANTGHRSSFQSTPMEPSNLMEQQMTNPYPYRWWTSLSYPTIDSQQNNASMRAQTFNSPPLCHAAAEPRTSTPLDYPQYDSTFMFDEPHSAMTATMTYSDVPRIKLQAFYGMSHVGATRQASTSYVYPLGSQSVPPTPLPPPPYGAFHSTVTQNTTASGIYPNHHNHCPMDVGINVCSSLPVSSYSMAKSQRSTDNSQDFHSQYQQSAVVTSNITNRRQNLLGDNSSRERCQQTFPTDCYSSTSITSRPSNLQVCSKTHSGLTDTQSWLSGYRSTMPNCSTNYQSYTPPEEYQSRDIGQNIESVHSTSSQEDSLGSGINPTIASVLDRLESANCLLDLSKQNELVTNSRSYFSGSVAGHTLTNVVDTPVTNTFTQSSPRTVVSCGMRPPVLTNQSHNTSSPLQTLPSFSSQFGTSCSSCVDPKKRKSSTVRELLQAKSKNKVFALMKPVPFDTTKTASTSVSQSAPSINVPTSQESRMPNTTSTNCVSTTLGSYPIPSVRYTLSTATLESPCSKNPPPYPTRREIRFLAPVAATRKPAPVSLQPIPVVFLQNVPQKASDKQVVTNWQVMLQSPSVRHNMVRLPLETRSISAGAAAKSLELLSTTTPPRHSLLREALSGGLQSYGAKNKSQMSAAAISMPVLVPIEKETSSECLKTLLTTNKPHSNQVVPSEITTPSNVKQITKIDFRPQHYEMDLLQIGSYVVKNSPGSKYINKFKILFAKRKFIYEYQVVNVVLPNHDRSVLHTATIEVPFNIINAIHCNDQEILIAVTQTPELFLCCKRTGGKSDLVSCENHFERGRKTDITGGILRTNHLHKIYLLKCRADMLRTTFETFDPSFKIKMQTPILEVIEIANLGTPGRIETQVKRQRIVEVIQPVVSTPNEAVVINRSICHCQVSCRSNRCSCMKSRNKCGRGSSRCSCKNCNNPLNVLDSMGFSIEACAADTCLIQNIVSYKGNLKEMLKKKVTFPCCNIEVTIKECIPGKVHCPNGSCNGLYKYSWCDSELQDEEKEPRNHCSMCRLCQECIYLHCNACRRCNIIQFKGVECPDCNNLRDTTFNEIRDIANVLLLLANSVDRTEEEDSNEQLNVKGVDSRSCNVQVVNVDDSEDIENIGIRAPDAINEIEVEGESYDQLIDDSGSVRSQEFVHEMQRCNGRDDDDEEEEDKKEGANVE